MSQNTLGVWHYDQSKYADWGWVRDSMTGHMVASVNVPHGSNEARHRADGTDPCEQRARLIAAAPELLEALEKAVSRQGFSNDDLISARAIISKAKGEP
jgi:hypothetical protein